MNPTVNVQRKRWNKSCRFFGQLLFVMLLLVWGGIGCIDRAASSSINQDQDLPKLTATETMTINQPIKPALTPTVETYSNTIAPPEPVQIIATPTKNYDYSVLTLAQRERLYQTSLNFLADTEEKAIQIAKDLNYVDKWGHPATFCGPLSIGILQQAGLVDRTVDLHDFWLLNPRDEFTISTILEETFPPEDYLWYRTHTPLNEFDFNEFPLYSGDFLYLYAGPRGTFEHMLTVSRVDEFGRAYAVTNELYSGTYSISEVLLYDPQNPEVGFFYDLTNIDNMYSMGVTGFGGFQLWRPLTGIEDPTPTENEFVQSLDSLFERTGGEWHIQIKEVGGSALYSYFEDETIHPGSVIKVPLAMLFFEALRKQDIPDINIFLNQNGAEGRTYEQLLEAMLVNSEEEATEILYSYTKNQINLRETLDQWGYVHTDFSPRSTTVEEITNIFEDLWQTRHITELESELIKEYLGVYTSGDDSRIGVIRKELPKEVTFFSKRGSLAKGRVIVAEVAVLQTEETAYILSLFAYPDRGKMEPTYDDLEKTIESAAFLIWDYIRDLN